MATTWQLPRAFDKLPQALVFLRELRGLTQAEIVQATGLTPAQISVYEAGVREPKVRSLSTVLRATASTNLSLFYAQLRVFGYSPGDALHLAWIALVAEARRDHLTLIRSDSPGPGGTSC